MISFRLFPVAIMFVYVTGILGVPTPIVIGNSQDKPSPTLFSIPMNLSPGLGMPNFNQVPRNVTDLLNMLENNAELSPTTRSSIVADLLRNSPPSVNKPEQETNRKKEKPMTITFEPVMKKSQDAPADNKPKVKESSPPLIVPGAQKDNAAAQFGKPESNFPPSGYEEEEEYHVEEKHAKEEEKVIAIPISLPVDMASAVKELLPPTTGEPRTDLKSSPAKNVLHIVPNPVKAKMVAAEKDAHKSSGKDERELKREVSAKENPIFQFERPDSGLNKIKKEKSPQSRNKHANIMKEGKITMIPSAVLADLFNDIKSDSNKPEQLTTIPVYQDRATQTEPRIPSVPPPNPALVVDFLKNIVPKLEILDSPQHDKSIEKEDQQNPIPPRIMDILNSFESILNNSQKRAETTPQNMFPTPPRPTKKPVNMAIPILASFDSGLGEPGQETAMPVEREEEPLPIPEPIAKMINAFLGPESRLDEPKQEEQPAEKDSDFEPMVSNDEKKIFQIMYVKHMTFKLQIHMKVWHTFFSYISRDTQAADDCTVILTHVSKFYKQLTIDVEIVQKFKILYKVVRMMTHNDENLKAFFEKTAKQPPKVDLQKINPMKDMQNMEKWQNEMVANLWKDAMSHFDDKLEHVENFFKDVLANHERASSVLDLPPSVSRRHMEYLGGKISSKVGNGFSIVDTEITKIRMRRKIYRDPTPSTLQSILNEGLAAVKQM